MSLNDSKEFKLIIRKDQEPELYAWAKTLNYGVFPKEIMKILSWLYRNDCLNHGGVKPINDLFVSKEAVSLLGNLGNKEFESEVLSKLDQITQMIESKSYSLVEDERKSIKESNITPSEKPTTRLTIDKVSEHGGSNDNNREDQNEDEEGVQINLNTPFTFQ